MHSGEVFGQFREMFPSMARGVTYYAEWAKDAIRLETMAGIDLIFEFHTVENWSLSTAVNEEMRLGGK